MSPKEISDTLETLLHLQEIDSKLAELEISKVYYPKLLEDLRNQISQLTTDSNEHKELITDLKRRLDENELEIKIKREKLQNSQERLLTVKSNKEYDAVQQEIQSNEETIAQLEEESIQLMEELEIAEKKKKEIDDELDDSLENNEKQIEQIEKKFTSIEDTISKIKKERDKLSSSVNKKILATYERISKGTHGHAIVKVTNRVCGGCFQSLPPRKCQKIKQGNSIIFCEACGRILVWDNEMSD